MKDMLARAKWIIAPKDFDAPIIEKRFTAGAFTGAKIAVSALGFFTLYVNGRRVGDEYFLPSNSIVSRRDTASFGYPIFDELTYRIYYTVYDISDLLAEDENSIEVRLGNGWYRQTERTCEGATSFGEQLGAIFAIELRKDGKNEVILSDGTERATESAIVYNQLFIGEVYDARRENGRGCKSAPVAATELPETLLCPEIAPPDRAIRRITPALLFERDGERIFDTGENVSGFVRIKWRAPTGERVVLRYAEELNGTELDFASTGSGYTCVTRAQQIQTDELIGDGEWHIYEPSFVWHAFRYFSVSGEGEPLAVVVVHTDAPVTSEFESSCAELDLLYGMAIRSQLGNMHGGVPSDCPHRERLGYTGDGQIVAPMTMLTIESRDFYRKWMRDVFDSQCKLTGHVNHTAPFFGGGGGPCGWGGAAITLPYNFYKHYGETDHLYEYYANMRHYVDYIETRIENGLVVKENDGGWCLGDWATLAETVIPADAVNTALFITYLDYMKEIATVIGKTDDLGHYEELRQACRAALTDRYYNADTHSFAGGVQGANAYALACGIGDGITASELVKKYGQLGHFDTGFIGTDVLTQVLAQLGETELIYKLLTTHELGSYPYMADRGATTVWESWCGDSSHNHPMFGAPMRLLFTYFLGITQAERSAGYERTVIEPHLPRELDFIRGSLLLPVGRISVSAKRTNGQIHFSVDAPDGLEIEFKYNSCKQIFTKSLNIII